MPLRIVAAGFAHPHIASFLKSGVKDHAGYEIVGVWDPQAEVAAKMGEQFGVPVFADYREMLERTQADALATGAINRDRGAILAEALSRGVHCISDKPLCTTAADVEAIAKAAEAGGAMVSLLLTMRFGAPFVAAKRLIEQGRLGRVVSIVASNAHPLNYDGRPAWMFDPVQYGGLINDLAVHMIDLVRWYSGREVVTTYATRSCNGICPVPDFADAASIHCTLAGGGDAAIATNWLAGTYKTAYCHFTIFGTKGIASWDQRNRGVFSVSLGADEPFEIGEDLPARGSAAPADDFLKLIAGEPCVMTPPEAIRSTRATLAAQTSAEIGRPVDPIYVT